MTRSADLREELAALSHDIWAHWMRYLFTISIWNSDGSVTIQADDVKRWFRQAQTDYADLSEAEKESDRHQADKILKCLAMRGQPEPIGEQIRRLRNARGMSQEGFANKLRTVHILTLPHVINELEHDNFWPDWPSVEVLERIARALDARLEIRLVPEEDNVSQAQRNRRCVARNARGATFAGPGKFAQKRRSWW